MLIQVIYNKTHDHMYDEPLDPEVQLLVVVECTKPSLCQTPIIWVADFVKILGQMQTFSWLFTPDTTTR